MSDEESVGIENRYAGLSYEVFTALLDFLAQEIKAANVQKKPFSVRELKPTVLKWVRDHRLSPYFKVHYWGSLEEEITLSYPSLNIVFANNGLWCNSFYVLAQRGVFFVENITASEWPRLARIIIDHVKNSRGRKPGELGFQIVLKQLLWDSEHNPDGILYYPRPKKKGSRLNLPRDFYQRLFKLLQKGYVENNKRYWLEPKGRAKASTTWRAREEDMVDMKTQWTQDEIYSAIREATMLALQMLQPLSENGIVTRSQLQDKRRELLQQNEKAGGVPYRVIKSTHYGPATRSLSSTGVPEGKRIFVLKRKGRTSAVGYTTDPIVAGKWEEEQKVGKSSKGKERTGRSVRGKGKSSKGKTGKKVPKADTPASSDAPVDDPPEAVRVPKGRRSLWVPVGGDNTGIEAEVEVDSGVIEITDPTGAPLSDVNLQEGSIVNFKFRVIRIIRITTGSLAILFILTLLGVAAF